MSHRIRTIRDFPFRYETYIRQIVLYIYNGNALLMPDPVPIQAFGYVLLIYSGNCSKIKSPIEAMSLQFPIYIVVLTVCFNGFR